MKMKKKLLSIALAIVMMMGLAVPAVANDNIVDQRLIMPISSELDNVLTIKAEDYENGDGCIYMMKNGEIIYQSYVDRSANCVINKDFSSGVVEKRLYAPVETVNTTAVAANGASTQYVGKIGYRYYMQGTPIGERYIRLTCTQYDPEKVDYNWAGRYATLASFAGLIAGVYGLPVVAATQLAKDIAAYAGVTIGAGAIVLGAVTVKSQKDVAEWLCSSQESSHKVTISGAKHTFKLGGQTRVHYVGSYYTPASYDSHNTTFANICYESMWGNDMFDIISWA